MSLCSSVNKNIPARVRAFSPSARRDRGTVASKRELSVLAQAQQSESNLIVDSGAVGGG